MSRNWLRVVTLLAASVAGSAQAAGPAWIDESNANARPLLELMAKYAPEQAANLGVDGHDADVLDLKAGVDQRFEADAQQVTDALQARLAGTTDPHVRQDLQILIDAERDQRQTNALNRRLMLPYYDVAGMLFGSFRTLLDPRVEAARYPAAPPTRAAPTMRRVSNGSGRKTGAVCCA